VFLIALTGGIAAGKSTVAEMLRTLGAETIDADQVAREVVEPGSEGIQAVVESFGEDILAESGELDRAKLAKIIFSNPSAREKLEGILHPRIRARTAELIKQSDSEIVVYSVPLLVESGVDHDFDFVVTVEAGEDNQLARLVQERGMDVLEAKSRIASQATAQQRKERADYCIDASGTIELVQQQVLELWEVVKQRALLKASGS
jgi:dephospho-CoA kinase